MNNLYIKFLLPLIFISITLAQYINPTLSIRYENFIEELLPGVAIGIKLNIDEERYTGFEVNTDQEDFDSRLILGWKWAIIGLGTKLVDAITYPSFTFGGSYSILDGLYTNIEYVTTPNSAADINDHIRLALLVTF